MRTTLDLDDELLAAARRRAAEKGATLTAVVEPALADALSPNPRAPKRYKLRWKTHKGRIVPGVDIADRDSPFDAMDDRR
jgi:hypothetical protein